MTQYSPPQIAAFNQDYANLDAIEILRVAIEEKFVDQIALVSSFGAEAVILLHMVSKIKPDLPVIFIDTGKLFGETKRYLKRIEHDFGLTNIITKKADPKVILEKDPNNTLWSVNANGCCEVRKTIPYQEATAPYAALITGRKKFQSKTRADLDIFELSKGQVKVNPLINWQLDELKSYITDNDLPRHPLVKDGYLSIGCMPCTERVASDAEYRDGRWSGLNKTECGIHL